MRHPRCLLLLCLAAAPAAAQKGEPGPAVPLKAAERRALAERWDASRRALDAELARTARVSEKYQPALRASAGKEGVDPEALGREVRAVFQSGKGEGEEAGLGAPLVPALQRVVDGAGIRPADLLRELGPQAVVGTRIDPAVLQRAPVVQRPLPRNDGAGGAAGSPPAEEAPRGEPPAREAPAAVEERAFAAPFTFAESRGGSFLTWARRETGELQARAEAGGAGSSQVVSSIGQRARVGIGFRRVQAYATFTGTGRLGSLVAFAGYSNTEALVTLRVLDGSRVMCEERVSLQRISAPFLASYSVPLSVDRRLGCAFDRDAAAASDYSVVLEVETWAGAEGAAGASARLGGSAREFSVLAYR